MSQAKTSSKPKVLVAPLDWGLGHATRCIPIIKALINQGCTVFLAGEGSTKILLQKEFPQLNFLPLKGYRVRYAKHQWMLPFSIVAQIPKILLAIKKENNWLRTVAEKYSIDAVISDNRFGLSHRAIPCVFMTHQLSIKSGFGNPADRWLQQLNYRFINRFSECWVPDSENENNLGGELSHPKSLPAVPVKYMGTLSRFRDPLEENPKHILILLSGPEPQRTIFEALLLEQLKNYRSPVVFIRGLPGHTEELHLPATIEVYNHLPADQLQQKIADALFVVSRCGYSTVLDMAALEKKTVLVPTPGQTEQEYLARHLMKKNLALCLEQKKFHLTHALELASAFPYQLQNFSTADDVHKIIPDFVAHLRSKETNPVNPDIS
ncbi:MAG TPA: glycosyltransferase [Flavisolibacter sp.]|nr:glycosyltransferase [Flavisolibacter sp.]